MKWRAGDNPAFLFSSMWPLIVTIVSAVLFFGFVSLSISKFGLLSCWSAYGPKWKDISKSKTTNWWSIITIVSAAMLMPVLLELSKNPNFQFLGFLAPLALLLVGFTPNYATDKTQNIIHQIGAYSAIVFILVYIFLIPKMFIFVLFYLVVGLLLSLAKDDTVVFWIEMAMYLSIYTVLIILCGREIGWFAFMFV